MGSRFLRATTMAGLLIGALAPAASASGTPAGDEQRPRLGRSAGAQGDGLAARDDARRLLSAKAAAPDLRRLAPASENFDVVSKLATPFPYATTHKGQIGDLTVYKGTAYLNGFDDPECRTGGVHIVDVSNPARPKRLGFVGAAPGLYHGEGSQAITLDTPEFTGDVLAVNNEPYSATCAGRDVRGGFDLIDVTNPAKPTSLVRLAGDRSDEGSLVQDPTAFAYPYHSVFMWQDGPRAYLVAADDVERSDVDIFDITDPLNPRQITDLSLVDAFPQIVGSSALGNEIFLHDAVVKRIDGRMTMLADYGDAGYVQLDVTDPAKPKYITDTSFDFPDPLTGIAVPEGNAHQAEFSADNRFFLAADEDIAPYRPGAFSITTGPASGELDIREVFGAAGVPALPDRKLSGPTVYGGYGCNASKPIPKRADYPNLRLAGGEEAILVLQRGPAANTDPANREEGCFPGVKATNAIAAGWDAVLLTNRHDDPGAGDPAFCGSGGYPEDTSIVTLCTTHTALHSIFGTEPDFSVPYVAAPEPVLGAQGERVQALTDFDGWGATHLYDAKTSQALDAYAIPEALDPRFALGFGDLSVHEFATDPATNLAYAAYSAGGMRAFRFSREDGLVPTGKFIDPDGSNFWGVEQFTAADGQSYVAGSDRDFGLVILKYTGPGAEQTGVKPPAAPPPSPAPRAPGPVAPPVPPVAPPRPSADSTFSFTRGAFARGRFTVRFTVKGPGISSAELTAVINGHKTRITRRAVAIGAAGAKRYTVRLTARESVRLRRALRRTRGKRLTGTVRAAFTARGRSTGKVLTRRMTLR